MLYTSKWDAGYLCSLFKVTGQEALQLHACAGVSRAVLTQWFFIIRLFLDFFSLRTPRSNSKFMIETSQQRLQRAAPAAPTSQNGAGAFPPSPLTSLLRLEIVFYQPSNALISHSQSLLPSVSKALIATALPNRRPPTTTPWLPPICPPYLAVKQILWCAQICGQRVCGCLRGRWRRSLRRARILMRRRFLRLAKSSCTPFALFSCLKQHCPSLQFCCRISLAAVFVPQRPLHHSSFCPLQGQVLLAQAAETCDRIRRVSARGVQVPLRQLRAVAAVAKQSDDQQRQSFRFSH